MEEPPADLDELRRTVAEQAAELERLRAQVAKGEARKRILAQLNKLLDDQLFETQLILEITRSTYGSTCLDELVETLFGLLARVLQETWYALVIDLGSEFRIFRSGTLPAQDEQTLREATALLRAGILLDEPGILLRPLRTNQAQIGALLTPVLEDRRSERLLELFCFHVVVPIERMIMLGRLQAADKAKDEFLRTISHELRTPLNIVKGFAYLLKSGQDPESPQADWIDQIHDSARHMEGLVTDLLDYSAMQAGRLSLHVESLEFAQIAEQLSAQMGPILAPKQQRLTFEGTEGTRILADHKRLLQILFNLVSNASKYGPEGSPISVRLETRGNRVRLSVSNEGRGLTDEERSHLFTAFQRLDQHQSIGGIGLGLTISKSLVEASGGEIGVESEPGQGTSFWFTLPLAKEPKHAQ